jgi:hypothetical protein
MQMGRFFSLGPKASGPKRQRDRENFLLPLPCAANATPYNCGRPFAITPRLSYSPNPNPSTNSMADQQPPASTDDEEAVLARAQAVITRVLDRETDPNPRLLHTLATLCELHDQRSAA